MPTPSDSHVDSILTRISVAHFQDAGNFIAGRVFQDVSVPKQSDGWFVYDQGDLQRAMMTKRGPGADADRIDYRLSTDQYHADVWAVAHAIDDQTLANADVPLNPRQDAVQVLTQQDLLRREVEFNSNFFSTGVWANQPSVAFQWDDAASSPLEDIEAEIDTVGGNTGFEPNVLVLGRQVWRHLKNHPDIVDRIKHTASEPVTEQLVARLLGVDEVLIGRGVQNTADEGLANTISRVLGRSALLVYRPSSPGLKTPAAGYTFTWSGLTGARSGRRILRYEEPPHREVVEIESAWDMKIVSTALGSFFNNVVSSG